MCSRSTSNGLRIFHQPWKTLDTNWNWQESPKKTFQTTLTWVELPSNSPKTSESKDDLHMKPFSGDLTSKHRSHGSADPFEDVNRNQLSSTWILYIPSLKLTAGTWKLMVGRCISYWNSPFSGAMLVSGRVNGAIFVEMMKPKSSPVILSKPPKPKMLKPKMKVWNKKKSKPLFRSVFSERGACFKDTNLSWSSLEVSGDCHVTQSLLHSTCHKKINYIYI